MIHLQKVIMGVAVRVEFVDNFQSNNQFLILKQWQVKK
jgi:hypothetical protein